MVLVVVPVLSGARAIDNPVDEVLQLLRSLSVMSQGLGDVPDEGKNVHLLLHAGQGPRAPASSGSAWIYA